MKTQMSMRNIAVPSVSYTHLDVYKRQDGNDGGTVPASLSQQGFFTADLSIPVTSRSAAISLILSLIHI